MNLDWSVVLGLSIGLAGVGIAFLAWFWPRLPAKRLSWTRLGNSSLVSEGVQAFPSLKVTFRDAELPQLTLWHGKLWNGGHGAILKEDLRSIRLQAEGARILGVWMTSQTGDENGLRFLTDAGGERSTLTFDFLNRGDGCEFSLLHDGPPDSRISLDGSIVGGNVHRAIATDPKERQPGILAAFFSLVALEGLAVFGAVVATLEDPDYRSSEILHQLVQEATGTIAYRILAVVLFLVWLAHVFLLARIRWERTAEPSGKDLKPIDRTENGSSKVAES